MKVTITLDVTERQTDSLLEWLKANAKPSGVLMGAAAEHANESIARLSISVRCTNALRDAGIHTIGQLIDKTKRELLKYKGLGAYSLAEIEDALDARGLLLK